MATGHPPFLGEIRVTGSKSAWHSWIYPQGWSLLLTISQGSHQPTIWGWFIPPPFVVILGMVSCWLHHIILIWSSIYTFFLSRYCLHRACWTWLDKNYNANQGSMCSVNVFEPTKYRKLMGFYWISQVIDIWMIFGWSSFIYTVYIYIYLFGWSSLLASGRSWGSSLATAPCLPGFLAGAALNGGVVDGCGWLWMMAHTVYCIHTWQNKGTRCVRVFRVHIL